MVQGVLGHPTFNQLNPTLINPLFEHPEQKIMESNSELSVYKDLNLVFKLHIILFFSGGQ